MSSNIANLGDENVIRDTPRKLDKHMLDFFFSKYSQSVIYRGRIYSLPKLIQMYGNDESQMRIHTQDALTAKLSAHFTTVTVTVSIETRSSGMTVVIDANVTDDLDIENGIVSVGYTLNISDSKLKQILTSLSDRPIFEAA